MQFASVSWAHLLWEALKRQLAMQNEKPQNRVNIRKGFYWHQQVTQEQYQVWRHIDPAHFKFVASAKHP
jgi:hypothetical protein